MRFILGGAEDMNGEVMGSEHREGVGRCSVVLRIGLLPCRELRVPKDFKLLLLSELCFGMIIGSWGRCIKQYESNAERCL